MNGLTISTSYKETPEALALRQEVEAFLNHDAALLDAWRLEEWAEFLSPEARYMVPSLDSPEGDYKDTLYLISDDYLTLRSRLSQLKGTTAWVENPQSRTRRLVSNIKAQQLEGNNIAVSANFAIWRFHLGSTDAYVGHYEHVLERNESGELRFKIRKSILDMETLRPHGRLSVIL